MQARSQYLPQIYGSGSYTRTLKSQYSGAFGGSTTTDTTTSTAPPGPCNQYLKDASASVNDRLAGLDQAARCASGSNPFASLKSLPFGQVNQYNFGLSLSQLGGSAVGVRLPSLTRRGVVGRQTCHFAGFVPNLDGNGPPFFGAQHHQLAYEDREQTWR